MRLENICFKYGKTEILKDINCIFEPGKIYGIVGHNGAGKTTLLRIMLGLLKPTTGSVIKDDNDVFSYIPEKQGIYGDLTVSENIKISLELRGEVGKCIIGDILKKWNLNKNKAVLGKRLSTGQLARLKFICNSVSNANILIADEPTLGVDARTNKLMEEEIKNQKKQGNTVILTSHNIRFIENICDEVIIINNNSIVFSGDIAEIQDFEDLYLDYTTEEEGDE